MTTLCSALRAAAVAGVFLVLHGCSAPVEPAEAEDPALADRPEFASQAGWYDQVQWVYEYKQEYDLWHCRVIFPDGREGWFDCGTVGTRILVGIQPGVPAEALSDLWEAIGLTGVTFHWDDPYRHARGWVPMRQEREAMRIGTADSRIRWVDLNWTGPALMR